MDHSNEYPYCSNSNGSKNTELFTGDSLLELCNSFWTRYPGVRKDVQPYLRGCKWSPDGTCCLSVVNHDGFHVMELPRDLYEGSPNRERMITLLPAVIHVKESGLVYDFCWYPKMNSHYPETCSWISTKINSPIQMWDAYNGSLRCSYRGFNAVDEMEPALSVTFINQGERIVGGYKNCLRTFDVERPGRDFLEHKIKSPASCFATHGKLLAVGSWNANIKLFSILDNGTYKSVGNFHAHTGGITHLQFTPDGTKLVSGARKDHNLCVWDIRYHRRPLNILKRSVSTNQRIYFDISNCGRYLVSGGTDGVVRVWDNNFIKWTEQFDVKYGNRENATFRFPLYRDCCNSISIHPSRPILATGSGQFHFLDPVKVLELECDSGTNCEDITTVETQPASNNSSPDEHILIEDVLSSEVHKTNFTNKVEICTQGVSEYTSGEVHTIKSTEEFIDKVPDQDIAITNSESPPAKKPKWSNNIISTVNGTIDIESPVCIPILETCGSKAQTDEEPPSKKSKRYEIIQPLEEVSNIGERSIVENIGSEPKIDIIDKAISEVTKDCSAGFIQDCKLITTKGPLDSISKQYSVSDSIVKDNINIEYDMKLIDLDKRDTVQKPNPTSSKELHGHSEFGTISELNSFKKSPSGQLRGDSDSQLTEKVAKLREADNSLTRASNVCHIEKPPDSKCIEDSAVESDDDFSDINENKMKYSCYAENNLTFWWIGKISDSELT